MSGRVATVEVEEGLARLRVPAGHGVRGPGKIAEGPFYNLAMALSRDLSVCLLDGALRRGARVLDGLAACGARGLRIALEVPAVESVVLNDRSPDAVALLRQNLRLNPKAHAEVREGAFAAALLEGRFHAIDIDPFGPPVPHLDAAVQAVPHRGWLGLTATDTAALCGTFPKTGLRRYGARTARTPFPHELGVRVLVGYLARLAASHDRGIEVGLGYAAEHFLRVEARVLRGTSWATKSLNHVGYLRYDRASGTREYIGEPQEGAMGPLWCGPLSDAELLRKARFPEWLVHRERATKLVELARGASALVLPHYRLDELSSRQRCSAPTLVRMLEELKARGEAAPSPFDPRGFHTDLSVAEVDQAFKRAASRR